MDRKPSTHNLYLRLSSTGDLLLALGKGWHKALMSAQEHGVDHDFVLTECALLYVHNAWLWSRLPIHWALESNCRRPMTARFVADIASSQPILQSPMS